MFLIYMWEIFAITADLLTNPSISSSLVCGNLCHCFLTCQHDKPGLLGMANSGANMNGSQFYIITVPTPHLDGKHVVFGRVIKGMGVVLVLELVRTSDKDVPVEVKFVIIFFVIELCSLTGMPGSLIGFLKLLKI